MDAEKTLTVAAPATQVWSMLLDRHVMGRLGTSGLSVMKTKADRMWDEFARNLAARLAPVPAAAADKVQGPVPGTADASSSSDTLRSPEPGAGQSNPGHPIPVATLPYAPRQSTGDWWARVLRRTPLATPNGQSIHIEIQRGDTTVRVDWPVEHAKACAGWLLELQGRR